MVLAIQPVICPLLTSHPKILCQKRNTRAKVVLRLMKKKISTLNQTQDAEFKSVHE